jgi:toxin ParE1/3/4
MNIFFTSNAEADLLGIGMWIAEDSHFHALRFVGELEAKALAIGERARFYPFAEGLEQQGIRRCLHKGYLIFYRIVNGQVEILHILNGARDYLSLLADDDQTNE